MDKKILAIIAVAVVVVAGVGAAFVLTNNNDKDDFEHVNVACITGDIHQIGVHLADQLGFMKEYGIKVDFEFADNGQGVVTALIQNGATASFGVVGAPPATLNTVNNELLDKSNAFNIVARANSEGSGLYIKKSFLDDPSAAVPARGGVPFYTVVDGAYTVSAANAAAWDKLIFGTPGNTSIQHIQMATIAQSLGLDFVPYTEGEPIETGHMYYVTVTNYNLTVQNKVINAGILWEPQYQKIVQETSGDNQYVTLARTNEMFPGHTCCVIIGNQNWMKDHEDTTVKFLKGYIDAVKYLNKALSDPTSEDYKKVVSTITNLLKSANLTDNEIAVALDNITYLYADSGDNLNTLKNDIKNLVTELKSLGALTKDVPDLDAFVNSYVNDTYLKSAVAKA